MSEAPPEGFRTLVVDGKPVGFVPILGDREAEIEAARQLLSSLGLERPAPTRVQSMFQQALAFAQIAADCHAKLNQTPRQGRYAAPFVVNMAFAIELYLKTLAEAHGSSLHGHDLRKLYDGLPQEAKSALDSAAPESLKISGLQEVPSIAEVLTELRSTFVDWRYLYERENTPEVRIPQAIFVANALHSACHRTGLV
ncbi:hypothetical protein FQZ97_785570 [compost metagenome]